MVLCLSEASWGPPEYERRVDRVWGAFHENLGRLTSRAMTAKVRWPRWVQYVALVLAYGCWV